MSVNIGIGKLLLVWSNGKLGLSIQADGAKEAGEK